MALFLKNTYVVALKAEKMLSKIDWKEYIIASMRKDYSML